MVRAILLGLLASAVFAQSTAPVRTFEVASVKPHEGPMLRLGVSTAGLRLTADCSNVLMLVKFAYNLKNFQVTGAAPLLKDDNTRWDIVAKAAGDAAPTAAEFRQMLQSLLAERFQLQVHREMREMPVYALAVGKNGPKFHQSDPDADASSQYSTKDRDMVITMPKATMSDVADAAANANLNRPVVDKTGLTGTYNIKLTYSTDASDISVFQAVEEQLGLKLEAREEMVEILVVDRVEKPSAN